MDIIPPRKPIQNQMETLLPYDAAKKWKKLPSPYDIDLIARMITTEADDKLNADEMAAMSWVVKNRLTPHRIKTHGNYERFTRGEGKTDIEKIIRTSGAFKGLIDNPDRFNNPKKTHLKKYNMAYNIATKVLAGQTPDLTEGAYFFNQDDGPGRLKIGSHYFRKNLK